MHNMMDATKYAPGYYPAPAGYDKDANAQYVAITGGMDVTVDGRDCRIAVTDNGTGFDIRHGDPSSTGTGLKVIRSTISLINHGSKRKIRLAIRNLHGAGGGVQGCEVTVTMPLGMRLPGLAGIEKN